MKSFHQYFKDRIDATDGTAVINAVQFSQIQTDARRDFRVLLEEANRENKFDDNVLLSADWFARVKQAIY